MNNEQLARLKAISGKDSYLYQLAQKDALESLETGERDILCEVCQDTVAMETEMVCSKCFLNEEDF